VHGAFAACLFALAAVVAVLTSRSWTPAERFQPAIHVGRLRPLAVLASALIFAQYLLGGILRHLDSMTLPIDVWSLRNVHFTLAFVVFAAVVMLVVGAERSRVAWLRRPAWGMSGLIVIQIGMGLAAWLTKNGLPATGYVARLGSVEQIVSRTAHMLGGVLLFMTCVDLTVRVFRVEFVSRRTFRLACDNELSDRLSFPGGVA
jgi:heme A synthase